LLVLSGKVAELDQFSPITSSTCGFYLVKRFIIVVRWAFQIFPGARQKQHDLTKSRKASRIDQT
jgi:hypothetical protein